MAVPMPCPRKGDIKHSCDEFDSESQQITIPRMSFLTTRDESSNSDPCERICPNPKTSPSCNQVNEGADGGEEIK
jgi:hypothetical protein